MAADLLLPMWTMVGLLLLCSPRSAVGGLIPAIDRASGLLASLAAVALLGSQSLFAGRANCCGKLTSSKRNALHGPVDRHSSPSPPLQEVGRCCRLINYRALPIRADPSPARV